ncbi:MAG: biotin--[acetyl-CoA-carboxylase] ligase [Pseudobdellovibrionaceae bacterium]
MDPTDDIRIGKVTEAWAKNAKLLVRYHEQLASTSTWAKERAFDEEVMSQPIAIYLTDYQTGGRGRRTNTWTSTKPGSSLYTTFSFMAPMPSPTLSPIMGLAVFRAAFATWPFLPWSLKAPNDLYLGDKKVSGLLLENLSQGQLNRLLVGFAINVFEAPEDVSTATSMIDHFPENTALLGEDWTQFLDRLLLELTLAISTASKESLESSECVSILWALNLNPNLKEKYTQVLPDGTLIQGKKKISWTEL